ncbi:hypothetical protein ACFL15_02460 [Patescibacteria group bacterium]
MKKNRKKIGYKRPSILTRVFPFIGDPTGKILEHPYAVIIDSLVSLSGVLVTV